MPHHRLPRQSRPAFADKMSSSRHDMNIYGFVSQNWGLFFFLRDEIHVLVFKSNTNSPRLCKNGFKFCCPLDLWKSSGKWALHPRCPSILSTSNRQTFCTVSQNAQNNTEGRDSLHQKSKAWLCMVTSPRSEGSEKWQRQTSQLDLYWAQVPTISPSKNGKPAVSTQN